MRFSEGSSDYCLVLDILIGFATVRGDTEPITSTIKKYQQRRGGRILRLDQETPSSWQAMTSYFATDATCVRGRTQPAS